MQIHERAANSQKQNGNVSGGHKKLMNTAGYDVVVYIHYRSKVWGHPDNFMFSMKTKTFIHQMSCKMNRK